MGFDSFLGNTAVVKTIRDMLAADRVPGALLFTGPEGVGKKTLALMMAKASVCERLAADFCGECARCRRVDEMLAGTSADTARRREMKDAARRVEGLVYFDVQLVAPFTRYILTEQIRLLRQMAYTHPFELPRRFFVIDQAQSIHWQAVDLLLKVLEEPPQTTTFVLICPNAAELRPTLRSRCQTIGFSPVDEALIEKLLDSRAQVPPAKRPLVARLAGGSVGKALDLDLTACLARRQPWLQFLESLSAGLDASPARASGAIPDWPRIFESTRALSDRAHFDEALGIGYTLLRDLLGVLECGERARVAHTDLLPRLKRWSSKLGFKGIELLKAGLDQAYQLQVRNVNQQLGFDALALGIFAGRRGRGPAA